MHPHYTEIKLNCKADPTLVAIVDNADAPLVLRHKWRALRLPHMTYAQACIRISGKREWIYLHRFLMGDLKGNDVDHVNHDGLDCRRENMRVATKSQNAQNRRKMSVPTTSRFKGVCWVTSRDRWQAAIGIKGHHKFLGYFFDEVEAAQAYNDAAQVHFGEFASLNDIN